MYRLVALTTTLLTVLSFTAFGQPAYNYNLQWQKVEQAIQKNLPRTVAELVDGILKQARTDKNQQQLLKALVHKLGYVELYQEDGWKQIFRELKGQLSQTPEPSLQVLHSIGASAYRSYFNRNQWQIQQRTPLSTQRDTAIDQWTSSDFKQEIDSHFQQSLRNAALLQRTPVGSIDSVIIKGNQRSLRPTLYDLLVHEALAYYKQPWYNESKPANAFMLRSPLAFAPARAFANADFASADSLSTTLKAVRLYQQLLAFRLNDKNTDALIDADIERLQFAHGQSTLTNRDELYADALWNIYNSNKNNATAMQAGYLYAAQLQSKALNYVPGLHSDSLKLGLVTAATILKDIISRFPKSEGGVNAAELLYNLQQQTLALSTELVNVPGKPFRALVRFKNVNSINLRIIELTPELLASLKASENYNRRTNMWSILSGANALKSWKQSLPVLNDMHEHSVEIKIDALPVGRYMLFISNTTSFDEKENALAAADFHVSNISYVRNEGDYFIVDRTTGEPLQQAKVQVMSSYYDYASRKNRERLVANLTSNANGMISLPAPRKSEERDYHMHTLSIKYKSDWLHLDEGEAPPNSWNNYRAPGDEPEVFFNLFTDRSIYRPGQTIYFKGIGINKKNNKPAGVFTSAKKLTLYLRDGNYQMVDSLKVDVNEYGSISGKFSIPTGRLPGNWQLELNEPRTNVMLKVEEYKRPNFFTTLQQPDTTYSVYDTVRIKGEVESFAGNRIGNAAVQYRVYRSTRWFEPWWGGGYTRGNNYSRSIWPPRGGSRQEITSGKVVANEVGEFVIPFAAIPDEQVLPSTKPVFDYVVEAVITDPNGETHEAQITTTVGYQKANISLVQNDELLLHVDSLKKFAVQTTTLNGKPADVPVSFRVLRLKAPKQAKRARYWEQPDTSVMTAAEFARFFPADEYRDEANYVNWTVDEVVLQRLLNDSVSKSQVKLPALNAGVYMVEAMIYAGTPDSVKTKSFFAVYSNNAAPEGILHFISQQPASIKPGAIAKFLHATASDIPFVVELKSTSDSSREYKFIKKNSGVSAYTFNANEADRGGFTVNRFYVYDNRAYTWQWAVTVPWSNKDLNISLTSVRNKVLPGSAENWSVKITGEKGEAVSAELLASMYDASLDEINPHSWQKPYWWPANHSQSQFQAYSNFRLAESRQSVPPKEFRGYDKRYDELMKIETGGRREMLMRSVSGRAPGIMVEQAAGMPGSLNEVVVVGYGAKTQKTANAAMDAAALEEMKEEEKQSPGENKKDQQEIKQPLRRNFQETAFFLPHLQTNDKGEVSFNFTMPDAITTWKLQLLSHTKNMSLGYAMQSIVSQKDLMVQPNLPRFLRQGDEMDLVTRIANLTAKEMGGTVKLVLLDAATMQPVDGIFNNMMPQQRFNAPARGSAIVRFPVRIPSSFNGAVLYRLEATTNNGTATLTDGEENVLPVLSNRILVTETLPITLRNTNKKNLEWPALKNASEESGITHQSLTVEYTTNPAWIAIQAMPYLVEYPYECSEQTWNRYYATALANSILQKTPRIAEVIRKWNTTDTSALISNLLKNQELKTALLEETPWVLAAQSETEQRKHLADLFNLTKLELDGSKWLNQLQQMQTSNGGFMWFKDGRDDRYITQYIATGMGKLLQLKAVPAMHLEQVKELANKAVLYLDLRMREDYNRLEKNLKNKTLIAPDVFQVQYLYMRSFFPNVVIPANTKEAYDFYLQQATGQWKSLGKMQQGMVAIAAQRKGNTAVAKSIIASLKEYSIKNEEMGMYWKEFNNPSWYWWQAPIESHALLTEAFALIDKNESTLNDLKTWMLRQKQTTNWKTTKATADAVYVLLTTGSNWLQAEPQVSITLGNQTIKAENAESGTGYFKTQIPAEQVKPNMGNVSVSIANLPANQGITTWGAVYWQYFQDMDKINTAGNALSISKTVFKKVAGARGEELVSVSSDTPIRVGDKLAVRLIVKTDRNMEYVHIKDQRTTGFEPLQQLSGYAYQDGLGYYKSLRDASTNFFISYLPRGTYVLTYEVAATQSGNLASGPATIQCMYAPEFAAHSAGSKLFVETR